MEIVKKRISLNPHISRHGSLIPYITVNGETNTLVMDDWGIDTTTFSQNGNWGKIPYDIDIKRCEAFGSFNGIGNIVPSELNDFFHGERLPFDNLTTKFVELRNVLNTMHFFKLIQKNGVKKWVTEDDLDFYEKLSKKTVYILPPPDEADDKILGVYSNSNFSGHEFVKLFQFLMKALGLFIVDRNYVKPNNGVPEVMYYTGIEHYLESMSKFKNSELCCKVKEYEFMGGDMFYHYLKAKQEEIDGEITYWYKALYRDEYGKITYPFLNLPIALNAECNNIGLYTAVPDTVNSDLIEYPITDAYIQEVDSVSPLKYLRRSNITYATSYKSGKEEMVEFPMILDESEWDEDGNAIKYELTQPYKQGFFKNMSQGERGYYYGDMIYRMDFIPNDENNSDGVVNIYYVIGGKFDFVGGKYVYVNAPTVPVQMPAFRTFVKNPTSISSWSIDKYLYMRNELSRLELYDENDIIFKGEYNSNILTRSEEEANQTWVFKTSDGDFVIDNGENDKIFYFNVSLVSKEKFTGIRFFEQKKWKQHSFKDDGYSIKMLLDGYRIPKNILELDTVVKNTSNVELVDFSNMNNIVKGLFYSCDTCDGINSSSLIALEQDFGKVDMIVENSYDVLFDRGYVTSFELHYKLGEINTMEDMENYGNNFFGF